MANSSSTHLETEIDLPLVRVYKNGTVERFKGTQTVPPSLSDSKTTVQSKDVLYYLDQNLQARLYLPKETKPDQKLPLLVYCHGGGFVLETAFSPTYHNYLNILVSEANVVAVSVDYRRARKIPYRYRTRTAGPLFNGPARMLVV
ncbi:Probable carboxylesterase 12 [Linum grandiflorum]